MNPSPTEMPPLSQTTLNSPPSSPSSPPNPSLPSTPPSPKRIFLIIGIAIFILITSTTAFFLGKSQNNKNNISSPSNPSTPPNSSTLSISPIPTTSPTSPTSPTPDPTANWKTYTTQSEDISVKYPPEWVYKEESPSYIIFKTLSSTIPAGGESQLDGVQLSILRSTYDEAVQRGINTYGNKENLSVRNLIGQHIWGTITSGPASGISGGIYILKNIDGKAFEFEYETVNGKNYETEARLMMETSSLGK